MKTTVEAIASKLVDQFGVEMDIYQVSENCMEALNLMGMLRLSKKAIVGLAVNQQLRMPPDCVDVKAVYRSPSSQLLISHGVTLTIQDIAHPPQNIWVPVPNSDATVQEITLDEQLLNYISRMAGPYIDFEWNPPFIELNEEQPNIIVVYSRIPVDPSTGLCQIPEEAFRGCLNHCLYVYFQPLFLQGKVAPYVWQEIKEWRQRKMAQSKNAYMMSRLSDNEMSKVHNIMSSFDRKRTRLDS